MIRKPDSVHLSHGVGEVGERSKPGEGGAACTILTRVASLPDLSRKRER